MSASLRIVYAAVTVFFLSTHGQRQMKIYRCHWITDEDSTASQTSTEPRPAARLGLLLSTCKTRLTTSTFQRVCVEPEKPKKQNDSHCRAQGSWSCDAVYDICSKLSVVKTSVATETTISSKPVARTQVIGRDNRCSKDGEIVASFLSFLLGFVAATVVFVCIAWKKAVLCFGNKNNRGGLSNSMAYQNGPNAQEIYISHPKAMIGNPNYNQKDLGVTVNQLNHLYNNQMSKKSNQSSAYEQMECKKTGNQPMNEKLNVNAANREESHNSYEKLEGKGTGNQHTSNIIVFSAPNREGSHKYIDMSLSTGKTEAQAAFPGPDMGQEVHYSVVKK